jgi:hypothetical protein
MMKRSSARGWRRSGAARRQGLVAVLALAPVVSVLVAVDALADRLVLGERDVVVRVDEPGRDDAVGARQLGRVGRLRVVEAVAADAGDHAGRVDQHHPVLEHLRRRQHRAAQQQARGPRLRHLARALGRRRQRRVHVADHDRVGRSGRSIGGPYTITVRGGPAGPPTLRDVEVTAGARREATHPLCAAPPCRSTEGSAIANLPEVDRMMMHHEVAASVRLLALAGLLSGLACGGAPSDNDSFGGGVMTTTGDAATDASSSGDAPTEAGTTTVTDPTSSSSSSSPSSATTTGAEAECADDDDCAGHPDGPICSSGQCTTPCAPGGQKPCYSGPGATLDVGPCVRGVQTCSDDGLTWGACVGEVVPASADLCANGVDDDCNGDVDDDPDVDGDGWGVCAGDCCDVEGGACFDAMLVNPGAVEYVGNDVDDDCDGDIDEVAAACDDGLKPATPATRWTTRARSTCAASPRRARRTRAAHVGRHLGQAEPRRRDRRAGLAVAVDPPRLRHRHQAAAGPAPRRAVASGHAADANDQAPPFAAFEPART